MEVGVSLGSVPVHRHIVDPGNPCALRMHCADASAVLNSNNAAVSEFLHVAWNKGFECDKSVCVGWGLDIRFCIKTLGVGPVWNLCSQRSCLSCCYCCALNTATAVTTAVKPTVYATLLPPTHRVRNAAE